MHEIPTRPGILTMPSSENLSALLTIWSEVLDISEISPDDDLLGLGGDSLAAIRCINRIIAVFGVELPIDFFLIDCASISQVASEIERVQQSYAAEADLKPFASGSKEL